jgi:hypothetical protein
MANCWVDVDNKLLRIAVLEITQKHRLPYLTVCVKLKMWDSPRFGPVFGARWLAARQCG